MATVGFDAVASDSDKKMGFFCDHGMRSSHIEWCLLHGNRILEVYIKTGAFFLQARLSGQS